MNKKEVMTQKTHWKKLTNPNYLGSWDIPQGGELVVTIKQVVQEKVMSTRGEQEDCIVAKLDGGFKPLILNATNCKTIAKLCESNFIEDWAGHRIVLITQKVRAFGEVVDAIRVKSTASKKEVLSPASPRWSGALQALRDGKTSVAVILKNFTVPSQYLKELREAENA
ncbi:hypothetical protein IJJ27_04380 [bacterium]|nr:hypothetical protein [bacterium]